VRATVKEKIRAGTINLITGFFLALGVEGLLYAGLQNPEYIPSSFLEIFQLHYRFEVRKIIQVTDCARYDSAYFYLLQTGHCRFSNKEFSVEFSVNSQGLRDDERSLEFPAVVALGDSYTMGWGVQQDESFPQLLEQELGQKVLNAGMSSFGTAREMKLLKQIRTDSLRMLILQYNSNDYGENQEYIKRDFHLKIRPEKSYDSLRKSIEKREKYFPFKHLYGVSKIVASKILKTNTPNSATAHEARTFLQIIKQARVAPGVRIIVFKVDDYKKLKNEFTTEIDSLLQTPEFTTLNIETMDLSHDLNRNDYFILDDHINKNGHEKIARKISTQVRSVSP
jgi:lysophospholipase L1-like esterase